jgi:hypothetical protein
MSGVGCVAFRGVEDVKAITGFPPEVLPRKVPLLILSFLKVGPSHAKKMFAVGIDLLNCCFQPVDVNSRGVILEQVLLHIWSNILFGIIPLSSLCCG